MPGPDRPLGRPRDPRIDDAVLEATLAALDEAGYGQLALEEVARRAGASKPAMYRRWPTRQRLVLAALATRLPDATAPDTGCTLCDLGDCLKLFLAAFEGMPAGVLAALTADSAADPDLREAILQTLFDPPRAAVAETLDRARARGDLRADADTGLLLDLLGALVHYRALFGHARTDDAEIGHAVATLLGGAAADYPALVEHNRALRGDPDLHPLHA